MRMGTLKTTEWLSFTNNYSTILTERGGISHTGFPSDFWTDDVKAQIAKKRIKEIVAGYQHHRFYIKDPRIVIFLNFETGTY